MSLFFSHILLCTVYIILIYIYIYIIFFYTACIVVVLAVSISQLVFVFSLSIPIFSTSCPLFLLNLFLRIDIDKVNKLYVLKWRGIKLNNKYLTQILKRLLSLFVCVRVQVSPKLC